MNGSIREALVHAVIAAATHSEALADASDTGISQVDSFTEDDDGDGFAELEPDGDGDCNDSDPEIFPGAAEFCDDGVDSDCDGDLDDEDCTPIQGVPLDGSCGCQTSSRPGLNILGALAILAVIGGRRRRWSKAHR